MEARVGQKGQYSNEESESGKKAFYDFERKERKSTFTSSCGRLSASRVTQYDCLKSCVISGRCYLMGHSLTTWPIERSVDRRL